jgi:general secretion pathway protein H
MLSKIKAFTLIELIVVIVIIGVILSLTTLSIGDGGQGQRLEQEVQRFTALFKLAQQEAIMQAKEMGVAIDKQGYRFYVLQSQQWQLLSSEVFHSYSWLSGMQVELFIEDKLLIWNEGESEPEVPAILILSSGELTPFELVIMSAWQYRLRGTRQGELLVQKSS